LLGVFLVAALALPIMSACTASPRQRPVKMGDVDTGATSVEAVRRQLKGTWNLMTLHLVSGETRTPVPASGQLQYDEYGNLTMRGTVTGSQQLDDGLLNITGQVAIDPVAHTIRFRAISAATPDERRIDPKLDASNVRYYEIAGDVLTTTIKDAAGATTAVATWKKVS
jgi:hypothetical protein